MMGFVLGFLTGVGVAVLALTGYGVWRNARGEQLAEDVLSEGRQ